MVKMMLGGEFTEQVRECTYLGSIISENLQYVSKIKTSISIAKEAHSRKRKLLCGFLNKHLGKRLAKCTGLQEVETWTATKEELN